jgi:hypothetical protein
LLESLNSGGINGLLESLTNGIGGLSIGGGSSGGGSSGGGSQGGGSSGGGSSSSGGSSKGQQAYLECLKGAQTPADLQKCANLLQ